MFITAALWKKILDLYSDYLICSFSQVTVTGLSKALEGKSVTIKSHDFYSEQDLDSKQLWLFVKPTLRKYERDDGVIIFADTLGEKPYTDERELICWHYDHVKGFNLLNCVYSRGDVTLLMGV